MFSSPKKDPRYFISNKQYNCPFCSTASVRYEVLDYYDFDWSNDKTVRCVRVRCQEPDCGKVSLHMTNKDVRKSNYNNGLLTDYIDVVDKDTGEKIDDKWENVYPLDDLFFYHQPNSSFVIDDRIPNKIREALDQANTCHKMQLSIGSSASLRKAIFELLSNFDIPKTEEIGEGENKEIKKLTYDIRLDLLKKKISDKFPNVDTNLFNDIKQIYSLISMPLHEQLKEEVEWNDFDSKQFLFLMGVVYDLLIQIFVEPTDRSNRKAVLSNLAKGISGFKKN